MKTKVLDDGSAYARVQSKDGKRAVHQCLMVCVNHARNKDCLRDHPLPRIWKEFQEDTFPRDFSRSAIIKRDYDGTKEEKFSKKQYVTGLQSDLQGCNALEPDEVISTIFKEVSYDDMMSELDEINQNRLQSETKFVKVHSIEVYEMLLQLKQGFEEMIEVQVETKYKMIAKKVKPMATPLPEGSNEVIEEASQQPMEMLKKHGKAFAFEPGEMVCVDPNVVAPMVIFTLPHKPWSLRPIPIPKAHLSKLIGLLNEKMRMGSLVQPCVPYTNKRWFTVPKKKGTLRFIQDMQPVNKVTIRDVGTRPIVDEFAEAFAGRAIYSMDDFYLGYDQFQLAL
ncbi:hypothetical protein L7F22_033885 [Adiantum nelumboides]|nr:hypothetical protein [Adiantum nelumboides]